MVRKKPVVTTKKAPAKPNKAATRIKKPNQKQQNKRKKISQQSDDEQIQDSLSDNQESESSEESDEQGSDDNQNSNSQQQSDDESSSSITPIKPQNFAVKQMQFRQRRGTKMNYLMSRKKQQEEDPFWAEHKGYFGDLNASDEEDEEDYIEDSQGKDQFDSDFGDTQSEHQDQNEEDDQKKMVDEDDEQKQKQKKRRAELMKKINAYKQKQKPQKPEKVQKVQKPRLDKKTKPEPRTQVPMKKQKSEQKITQQVGNRFIHQVFTQEQLLGQAAHTEYHNWLSLKKLISIQTQKKDFTRKVKHVEGSKVIYKNRLNQNGVAQSTYELDGVVVNQISDLTHFLQAN